MQAVIEKTLNSPSEKIKQSIQFGSPNIINEKLSIKIDTLKLITLNPF